MDYPKYQVSKMEGDYQVVFRTDMEEEFDAMLENIRKLNIKGTSTSTIVDKPYQASTGQEVCKDCGTPKILGRNGKMYCKPCYIKWAEQNKKQRSY